MKTKVFLLKGFNTCFTQVGQVRLQIRIPFFDSCRPTGRHIWVADLAKKEMFFFLKKRTAVTKIILHLYLFAITSFRYTFIM